MNIRSRTPIHRLPVTRVLIVQAGVCLLISLVCWLLLGNIAGYSAFLGGAIGVAANAYFAYRAFRYFGARSSKAVVQSLWSGEMGKLILTAAFFALVFVGVQPLEPVAVLGGYAAVLAAGASALLLVGRNPRH